jgi:hypothetical protein
MWRRFLSRTAPLVVTLVVVPAVSSPAQAPTGDNARRLLALREITLKSGVNAQQFETYFSDVYARTMAERIPGLQIYLLRGERGDRKDKYLMVWEFDSLARRNEYFPKPDVASERWTQLTQNMPQFELDKYLEPAEGDRYTDYVVLRR